MKSHFVTREFQYDGTQLRSLFGYLEHGVLGDSVISWIGPCDISFDHMVDGEDLLAKAEIRGGRMLHFIIERFNTPLLAAVITQRLFASLCLDQIRTMLDAAMAARISRDGDDLFFDDGKLSISIATASPVSSLIHFAINCTNEGTPVKTASLADLGLDPQAFGEAVTARFAREMDSIIDATMKVRWVK